MCQGRLRSDCLCEYSMVNLGFYDYADLLLGLLCIQKLLEVMTRYRCMGLAMEC